MRDAFCEGLGGEASFCEGLGGNAFCEGLGGDAFCDGVAMHPAKAWAVTPCHFRIG